MTAINRSTVELPDLFHVGSSPLCPNHAFSHRPGGQGKPVPLQTHQVVTVPVTSEGWPDVEHRLVSTGGELGLRALTLDFETSPPPEGSALVVAVLTESRAMHFAGIEVCGTHSRGRQARIVGRFRGIAHELLQPKNLTPRFNFDSMTFTLGFPEAILQSWAKLGVLQPVIIDRLRLCPRCYALPTFRRGCSHCGSTRITSNRAGITRYSCEDCHASLNDLSPLANCLRCQARFTDREAFEMELNGYVTRSLELLAQSR
jgi:hypothetical protein